MDVIVHDERVRRLQRLAYGADTPEAERAAAEEELLALRLDRDGAHDAIDSGDSDLRSEWPPAPAESDDNGHAGAARTMKWAIAIGAAALVIGVIVGSQIGRSTSEADAPAPAANPDAMLQADVIAAMPVAADTPAAEVFSRPVAPEDVPEISGQPAVDFDFGNGPVDFRLLATRADGTKFFAARDGADLCLFIMFVPEPEGVSTTAACTESGRFPNDGLRLGGSGGAGTESVDATWRPDGSIQIGVITGALPG